VNQDLHADALWLVEALARAIETRGGPGVARVLERLALQDLSPSAAREPDARRLPACRHLPDTIAAALMVDARVAAALAAVEPHLAWRQNPNYSDAVLGPGFMAGYAYSEIIGQTGFFPGEDFLLGLMILGPRLHYRDHRHPAPELYWTLTGPSEWRRGAGDFATHEADALLWHEPHEVHATRTGDTPLLAVWCWTEDTATAATLLPP
jgi:hypothetical protein